MEKCKGTDCHGTIVKGAGEFGKCTVCGIIYRHDPVDGDYYGGGGE